MKNIMWFIILAPIFINSMDAPDYPPTVTTVNQKLIHDAYLGDRHLGRIRAFLNAGADANFIDEHGRTPLSMAAYGAQLGTIEILLAHGANPNLEKPNATTPLASALGAYRQFPVDVDIGFQRRVIGSISRLIRAGAQVNHPSVQLYLERHPELRMVLKQAQEIAKNAGPQKLN